MDWKSRRLSVLTINCESWNDEQELCEAAVLFIHSRLIHKNLKDSKIGRGVNLVALDSKTFDVKLTETFDTYLEGNVQNVFLLSVR